MKRQLLLGNGINIHFGIQELYLKNIADRFKKVLVSSSRLYEYLFGISFSSDLYDSLLSNVSNLGIETIAAEVFEYVYTNMKVQISINSEYRLHNAIKASAINAIFYNANDAILVPSFNSEEVKLLESYDAVYTLNYKEFWDNKKVCTFLHGSYEPILGSNNKLILLFCSEQYHISEYAKIVEEMKRDYNMLPFSGANIAFSPLLDKQKVLNLTHYPAKDLYPSSDIFPNNPEQLYVALDSINSLEVFGVSPYGDDKLINCLKKIRDLTIFVYHLNQSEVSEWNRLLQRNCCKDSSLFWEKIS